MTLTTPPTGASLLIDALLAQGVNTVFCVPGESFLAAMDAMYAHRDAIHLVVCRHEGSAIFMAEAHAKATGRPGICFVTRAPGAAQATIGLHTAHQDATLDHRLTGLVTFQRQGLRQPQSGSNARAEG